MTRVNKIGYALLAIFLGGLGAQYFYAGKIFKGVLCLLFCWTGIPEIWGFICGIIALTKKEDGSGNIMV